MIYYHTDVFGSGPLTGNGLTVFIAESFPESGFMQKAAQEFKQFETIFLVREGQNSFSARIFTVEEELAFAGHPVLGAAAALCREFFGGHEAQITLRLPEKSVSVSCSPRKDAFFCVMDQGKAEFSGEIPQDKQQKFLSSFNLSPQQLFPALPMQVVSTGLPYLIVPISHGLESARIVVSDLERQLTSIGAKFAYILDVDRLEGRSWDNLGTDEDAATGSAAGPVGAYLCRHGIAEKGSVIKLSQGRFISRPSVIEVSASPYDEISVGGRVDILARGEFFI